MNDSQQIGEIFRTGLSKGPEPDPAIWEQIQKRMRIRDFWRSSRWIWAGTALLGVAAIAWIIGKQTKETTVATETALLQQPAQQPAEEQTFALQTMNRSSKEEKIGVNEPSHQEEETIIAVPDDSQAPIRETVESEAPAMATAPIPEEKAAPTKKLTEPQRKAPEKKADPIISQPQPPAMANLSETAP
ncbi:MAG: hypothetical protein J5792_08275, partial [Bacteroidales bacterium]|nr:hypothetical protein [Bacteroidales bacterium]